MHFAQGGGGPKRSDLPMGMSRCLGKGVEPQESIPPQFDVQPVQKQPRGAVSAREVSE